MYSPITSAQTAIEALLRAKQAEALAQVDFNLLANQSVADSVANATYKSVTGIDFGVNAAWARDSIIPTFSGNFRLTVSGSALNNKVGLQTLQVVLSHDNGIIDPIVADAVEGASTAAASASTPTSFVFETGTAYPVGTVVRFNVGGIVGDATSGFAIATDGIQLSVQEIP
jgi:hypothetical protein